MKKLICKIFGKQKKPKISKVIGYTISKTMHAFPSLPTKFMVIEPGTALIKSKNGELKTLYIGKSVKDNRDVLNTWLNRMLIKFGFIEIRIEGVIYNASELHKLFGQGSPVHKIKPTLKT